MGNKQVRARVIRSTVAAAAILGLFLSSAGGIWMMPTQAPVGRLVRNLGAAVREHPDSAQGHYLLGRVHSLAFTLKRREINVWERTEWMGLPEICDDTFQFAKRVEGRRFTEEELLVHLAESVTELSNALRIDSKPAHYHLSLGYMLDRGAVLAEKAKVLPLPLGGRVEEDDEATKDEVDSAEIEAIIEQLGNARASARKSAMEQLRAQLVEAAPVLFLHRMGANEDAGDSANEAGEAIATEPSDAEAEAEQRREILVGELLSEYWRELALPRYYAAFERSIQKDLALKTKPLRGLQTLIGHEAGQGYIRLMTARGARTDNERDKLARVERSMKDLEKMPLPGGITPIIFSVDSRRPIEDLLSSKTVEFDLNGDGVIERWPWVQPDTAILVWDPKKTGSITSGRQLFGSVTWWMFFEDGYHALDALDDDRNGWLENAELVGLALWHDRNTDGVSDPGEVQPIEETQVEAISVRGESRVGVMPANFEGLRMRNGDVLPTYDWITSPADAQPIDTNPAHNADPVGAIATNEL